ncbi:hypothetical protein FACS1894219_09780 [Clostridia bacterium]|nr:hypothetical protein FACS1894219_09780 [Clostridia bacterium]
MDDTLVGVCKKLHWNTSLFTKARKIQKKPNREFLLELLLAELDKRDRIQRIF